jgi:predicted aldo/keto reductase-like oxidoreductase
VPKWSIRRESGERDGRSRARAREDRIAGHNLGLRSDGTAWAPRARDITEAQAETILNKVLDAGINYIDTSIDYGLR